MLSSPPSRPRRQAAPGSGVGKAKKFLDYVCTMYYIVHMRFGDYTRTVRERLKRGDASFSVRQVARRVGVEPAYLSKVERNHVAPPSETKICRLAAELGEDRDFMLALGGKIATDLQQIIRLRPQLFASLLRHLGEAPEEVVLEVERQVRESGK